MSSRTGPKAGEGPYDANEAAWSPAGAVALRAAEAVPACGTNAENIRHVPHPPSAGSGWHRYL